jgi:hypothetical protein
MTIATRHRTGHVSPTPPHEHKPQRRTHQRSTQHKSCALKGQTANRDHSTLYEHHCTQPRHWHAPLPTKHLRALCALHRASRRNDNGTRHFCTTLTEELLHCPESTGCCRRIGSCTSSAACSAREQPVRHTTTPDFAAAPASCRITSITQIACSSASRLINASATPCATHSETAQHDSPQEQRHPTRQASDAASVAQVTTWRKRPTSALNNNSATANQAQYCEKQMHARITTHYVKAAT